MTDTIIKTNTQGAYDIQKLRIQMGNRIVANLRSKLGIAPSTKEEDGDDDAKKMLKVIRQSYERVTDGFVQLNPRTNFNYDGVISNYSELALVHLYEEILKDEEAHMHRLSTIVQTHPLWHAFLKDVKGVGGVIAAVIISTIDIHKAKYVSSIWAYAGLDVVINEDGSGEGRSRKSYHLREYEYTDKYGEIKTKKGITFNPFLKTKLIGVLGTSFKRTGGHYREVYDNYKHRIKNMKAHKDKSKGHIDNMAVRYAVKIFLKDLYVAWRELEGLPAHPPYEEAKLGHVHGR